MQQIKLLLLGFFVLMMTACTDQGHSHDDSSQHSKPNKHDTID